MAEIAKTRAAAVGSSPTAGATLCWTNQLCIDTVPPNRAPENLNRTAGALPPRPAARASHTGLLSRRAGVQPGTAQRAVAFPARASE